MQWLVMFWVIFVAAVYIGGYLFPWVIGAYTPNLAVVYAIVLIISVCSYVLRWRGEQIASVRNKEQPTSRQIGKKH